MDFNNSEKLVFFPDKIHEYTVNLFNSQYKKLEPLNGKVFIKKNHIYICEGVIPPFFIAERPTNYNIMYFLFEKEFSFSIDRDFYFDITEPFIIFKKFKNLW